MTRDLRALRGEQQGRGRADAVIGSGDESHAAGDAWKCWDVCGHARQNLLSETRSWIRGSRRAHGADHNRPGLGSSGYYFDPLGYGPRSQPPVVGGSVPA